MKRRRLKAHKRHGRNEHKVDYPPYRLIICSDNYMNEEKHSKTWYDDFKYFVMERHDVERSLSPRYRMVFHSNSGNALKIWLDLHDFYFSQSIIRPLGYDTNKNQMFVANIILKEKKENESYA